MVVALLVWLFDELVTLQECCWGVYFGRCVVGKLW